jgi:hypothetical protein
MTALDDLQHSRADPISRLPSAQCGSQRHVPAAEDKQHPGGESSLTCSPILSAESTGLFTAALTARFADQSGSARRGSAAPSAPLTSAVTRAGSANCLTPLDPGNEQSSRSTLESGSAAPLPEMELGGLEPPTSWVRSKARGA